MKGALGRATARGTVAFGTGVSTAAEQHFSAGLERPLWFKALTFAAGSKDQGHQTGRGDPEAPPHSASSLESKGFLRMRPWWAPLASEAPCS